MPINPYHVACVQTDVRVADETDASAAQATIRENLARAMDLVDYLEMEPRYGPKLMVFSEFSLTAVPESRTLEGYLNIASEIPGPITEIVGERARKHQIYIAMNTFEFDPQWPDRVFNCSFIVDPSGEVALKYRKHNDSQTGIPCSTNPGDFWEKYVEFYGGPECLFPVIDTPIGRLACITCYDIRFAELARCMALRGAEVLIHCTAEPSGEVAWRSSWDAAKQVRAWENQCYLVSTNNGRTLGGLRPEFRQRGRSVVHGPNGALLAITDAAGENVITARIDIAALRRDRAQMVGVNVPATSRFREYLPIYEKYEVWPIDCYGDEPLMDRSQVFANQKRALENAYAKGLFARPD
jgi:predicted amidohydrolase